jgi:cobaltochelatase CobN
LEASLLGEIRGRFLNPQWIKPLMKEGYSGARTMGSEFIEYLWGWQVTSPEIITSKVWQDVKSVYIDDKLNLKLDKFLSSNHQVHVQTNILAVMLVAIQKDFWKADKETIKQLSAHFAKNIIENGIPGSGHTHGNHPIYDFVKKQISIDLANKLQEKVDETKLEQEDLSKNKFKTIQEIKLDDKQIQIQKDIKKNKKVLNEVKKETSYKEQNEESYIKYLLFLALLILSFGLLKSIFFNKRKGV